MQKCRNIYIKIIELIALRSCQLIFNELCVCLSMFQSNRLSFFVQFMPYSLSSLAFRSLITTLLGFRSLNIYNNQNILSHCRVYYFVWGGLGIRHGSKKEGPNRSFPTRCLPCRRCCCRCRCRHHRRWRVVNI